MRKTLFILVCILSLYSCTDSTNQVQVTTTDQNEPTFLQVNDIKISRVTLPGISDTYNIIEITHNGKTHEFLKVTPRGGGISIAHWPSCKYCNNKE